MDNSNLQNARKMFKHACAFAECAYFCETEPTPIKIRTQWHTIPNIVNSVFACEVYIKSILVYYGMTHTEIKQLSHGLVGLWNKLKELDVDFATIIENEINKMYIFGKESIEVAESQNNIAALLYQQGRFHEAEKLFLLVRNTYAFKPSVSQRLIAGNYNNLGAVCYAQGKYAEAMHCFKQATDIYLRTLGDKHPLTRNAIRNQEICNKKL